MLSSEVLIPYALHTPSGRLIHVSEAENGLDCACICTACKSRVVARQGDVNVWHFAHATNHECVNAQETALHLAAKQLLAELGQIGLPPLYGRHQGISELAEPERSVPLTDISLEHRGFAGIVPDVYAVAPDGPLIIEIHVSHAVDEIKAERIAQHGVAAIEISLDRAPDSWRDPVRFRAEVLARATRSWLFHPRQAALNQALAERLEAEEARRQASRKAEEEAAQAAEAARLEALTAEQRAAEERRRQAEEEWLRKREHRAALVDRTLSWATDYYPKREQQPPDDLGEIRRDEVRTLFRSCPSRLAHYALVDQAAIRRWFDHEVATEVKAAWERYAPA